MREDGRPAHRIAEIAKDGAIAVAVAESLTSGRIAGALGAAPDASDWFRGGVVAYADEVKFNTLGVTPGPVITAECAGEMASGVLDLLGADAAVAVTGVGGPDPAEGKAAGTVFIATALRRPAGAAPVTTTEHHFAGAPDEVVGATVETALLALLARITAS